MWTFCLIKGLDTLPWSRRKAPFISSYWIFVCVVSLLFNFTPQFAFITAQPREPVDIQKQCHAEFKYLQPGHWLESICVHYHLNVLDSSSITEGMAAGQTWLIWEVNISRLFFFFKCVLAAGSESMWSLVNHDDVFCALLCFFKFFPLGITRLQRRLSCSAWQNQFMMSCKHEHLSVFSSQKSPKATCVYVQDTKTGVAGRNHESCLLGEKEDVVWRTGSVNKTYFCSYYFNRDDKTPLAFLANELL